MQTLENVLKKLLKFNCMYLVSVSRFLNEVQSYSGSNKMTDQNLATVFGPNILRAKTEDPQSIMGGRQNSILMNL